jgi:hypothetical protein
MFRQIETVSYLLGVKRLRDLTALTLQTYFSKLTTSTTNLVLSHESRDKIRDVLSSALRFAVQHDLLVRNPAESLRIPPDKRGKKRVRAPTVIRNSARSAARNAS